MKGAANPNDLDLLIEAREVGAYTRWTRGRKQCPASQRPIAGLRLMPSAEHHMLVWLSRGMHKVSRHLTREERIEIDVKRMIYPRWELDA